MRSDGRLFSLTPRVLELGYAFLSSLSLPEVAQPLLEELVRESQESSEGAILDGEEIVYVVRVAGPAIMNATVPIGSRMPAAATALGRALLSGLPDDELDAYLDGVALTRFLPNTIVDKEVLRAELLRVRAQGYALVDQELEEGLLAIAVPVRTAPARPSPRSTSRPTSRAAPSPRRARCCPRCGARRPGSRRG